jgi:hypothetical protein
MKRTFVKLIKPEKYDRAETLLGIAAEAFESGNMTIAHAAFDEWQRLVSGERTNVIHDPPQGPLRPMRLVRPWQQGK